MAVNSTGNHDGMLPIDELRESKGDAGGELFALGKKAEDFLESRSWCRRVLKGWLDIQWGKILGVFYFVFEPESPDRPQSTWVVVGDLPPGCVPVEGNPNGACALATHAARLQDWVDSVFLEQPVDSLIDVNVPPQAQWAMQLQSRLRIIRSALKQDYAKEVAQCLRRSTPRFAPRISAVRKRVLTRLKRRSIETNPFAHEIRILALRSPQEVAKKIIVRSTLGALAEDRDDITELKEWFARQGLSDGVDAAEADLLSRSPGNLSDTERKDLSWNGEFVRPLLWAGGMLRHLEFPSAQRSLRRLFPLIPPEVPTRSFIESFRLRRTDEILYQTDLHYCLAWTVVNSGDSLDVLIGDRAAPGVVVERNRAFQWLTAGSRWERPGFPRPKGQ
jgi:hypothetical protein